MDLPGLLKPFPSCKVLSIVTLEPTPASAVYKLDILLFCGLEILKSKLYGTICKLIKWDLSILFRKR